MNMTMMLLLHAYPHDVARPAAPLTRTFGGGAGPSAPRPQDPGPEGGEGESVGDAEGDEDDGASKPEREGTGGPKPEAPPATPDANPIDPRVIGSIH